MADVFISHIEEETEVALGIARGLEAEGFTTWYYERDSDIGPSYLAQVGTAIDESEAVLVLVSAKSLDSNQMSKEVERAYESGKHFLPVLCGITHAEFQHRQPVWRQAMGSAASAALPAEGASALVPRIVRGLRALGIKPRHTTSGLSEDELRLLRFVREKPHRVALAVISEALTLSGDDTRRTIRSLLDKGHLVQDTRDQVGWSDPQATFFTEPSRREEIDERIKSIHAPNTLERIKAISRCFFSQGLEHRRAASAEIGKLAADVDLRSILDFCRSTEAGERVAGFIGISVHLGSGVPEGEQEMIARILESGLRDEKSRVRYRAVEAIGSDKAMVGRFSDALEAICSGDKNRDVRELGSTVLQRFSANSSRGDA